MQECLNAGITYMPFYAFYGYFVMVNFFMVKQLKNK